MAHSRFRAERCAAHGIAVGLCTVATCKGAIEAKKVGRQLVEKLKPLRCHHCRRERGDAARRGEFYGATATRRGVQRPWCDECWGGRLARDKAAAVQKSQAELNRAAQRRGSQLRNRQVESTTYE